MKSDWERCHWKFINFLLRILSRCLWQLLAVQQWKAQFATHHKDVCWVATDSAVVADYIHYNKSLSRDRFCLDISHIGKNSDTPKKMQILGKATLFLPLTNRELTIQREWHYFSQMNKVREKMWRFLRISMPFFDLSLYSCQGAYIKDFEIFQSQPWHKF